MNFIMNEAVRRALGLSIQTPTEFFCRCWNEVIEKIESGDHDVDISSWPRQILQSIELELCYNAEENKKNKNIQKYIEFYNRLGRNNPLLKGVTNSLCFNSNSKTADSLLDDVKKEHIYLDNKLLDFACDLIIEEVNNCNVITLVFKKKIEFLIEIIIGEFIYKGFDINSLKDLPKHPLCIRTTEYGEVIIAPPCFEEIDRKNYESEKQYYKELSGYLKKRNISKRIGTINEYCHNTVTTFTVYYRIVGIRGTINSSVGKVRLSSELPYYDDTHSHSGKWGNNFIYAAINVNASSPESAIIKGIPSVESVVSLLTLKTQPQKPFVISEENAVVFQNNKLCLDRNIRSINRKDDSISIREYYESVDVHNYLLGINDTHKWIENSEIDSSIKSEIINSLFWYKKACNANEDSDRLLFSWIAMDSLFKMIKKEKIPTICANIISPHLYYTQWYLLYTYIRDCVEAKYIIIPEEIKEKSGLSIPGGQVIPKEKFLKLLENIEDCTDDEILKTKIQETKCLYFDSIVFEKKREAIIKDFQTMQIVRNMVIHSAVYNKNSICIYANKAYSYCTCILNCMLYNLEKQKTTILLSEMITRIDEENEKKVKLIKCEIEGRIGPSDSSQDK